MDDLSLQMARRKTAVLDVHTREHGSSFILRGRKRECLPRRKDEKNERLPVEDAGSAKISQR